MRVLDRTEMRPFAAGAARADDRNFAIQVDEPFEDGFGATERRPCGGVARGDFHLTFAVVAERRRLQHGGGAYLINSRRKLRLGPDRRERRDRQPEIGDKRLLADPVLRDVERAAVRTHERARLGRFGRRRRHVLELEGDDVDGAGEGADGIEIVVRRVDFDVRHSSRRRVVVRGERVHAVAETARRHGEHAAQLAAAKDAYRGSGGDDAGHYIADS